MLSLKYSDFLVHSYINISPICLILLCLLCVHISLSRYMNTLALMNSHMYPQVTKLVFIYTCVSQHYNKRMEASPLKLACAGRWWTCVAVRRASVPQLGSWLGQPPHWAPHQCQCSRYYHCSRQNSGVEFRGEKEH